MPAQDISDILERINLLEKRIEALVLKMEQGFVTKVEFTPVKAIAFGIVAMVMSAFGGSLINMLIKKP